MNSKIKFKLMLFLVMFVFAMIFLKTSTYAYSYNITASKTTLNVGDTASVTIKADDCLGQFSITSSDSSVVSVSDTSKWLENNSATINITAKKAGKANITLTAKNVSDTSGEIDVTGSKSVSITVSEPKKEETKVETPKEETPKAETPAKSSDATLKSITISGKKYNNPNTSITAPSVSADTSSTKIEAVVNNSKAKVTGTGTKELVTGTNKFTLKVTAEDGSTKSYTIKVTKLAEEVTTPNIVDESNQESEEEKQEEIELRLSSLVIEGVELIPKFEAEVFEYSVFITNIDELKVDAKANIEDAAIDITGNKEFKEGENTILIKLTKDDKTAEYKVIVHKTGINSILGNNENKVDNDKKENKKIGFVGTITDWWNKSGMQTIIYACVLGLLSAAISFAITIYKYTKPARETAKRIKEDKNI